MKNYEDLPDIIGVKEYSEWTGLSIKTSQNTFHSKDFPRLKNCGVRLLAHKEAVKEWMKN